MASAAYAQFVGRNYDEAMRLARSHPASRRIRRRAIACSPPPPAWPERPRSRLPHSQELRRAQPNISLAWVADQMPFKHDADREHYLEGFRRAGLD